MGLGDTLMKIVVKGVRHTLEEVMEPEIELFLGQEAEKGNKRNGFTTRTFGIKGVGAVELRVPRDRAGRFQSNVVPPQRHQIVDSPPSITTSQPVIQLASSDARKTAAAA